MKQLITTFIIALILVGCNCNVTQNEKEKMGTISEQVIKSTIEEINANQTIVDVELLERGVRQTAAFWMKQDGTEADFKEFCIANYIAGADARYELFESIQTDLEVLFGNFNKMSVDLKLPLHVEGKEIQPIDEIFGAWDPSAHFTDDMFSSKIAFIVTLNFPFYTLQEKNDLGEMWTRTQWAYARMGDLILSRVPAEVSQNISRASSAADNYISNYNVMMGNLRNESNEQLFPDGMRLISHWGLRDELKSDYADKERGLEKQEMIYQIMKHIVYQTIPQQVIDNDEYKWQPISNKIYKEGVEETVVAEPNTRYQQLYNLAKASMAADEYCPTYPSYIARSFDQQMEVSYDEIEQMFIEFINAPQVAAVSDIISARLGRELRPYDIWYDGFKSRSSISEDLLTAQTRKLYPTADAFQNGLPDILLKLGFTAEKANSICAKVKVDPSRGAGHAWGAQMRSDKARLRTRIGADGMDYKGYNIAVHEFGHNVEQTITLNDVDNYIMNGVPNTAFTEALAFVFQMRDMELLGYNDDNSDAMDAMTLDIFWGCYEIMGVSLVDMRSWKWFYENPDATVVELKETIIKNAKEIWNQYYAPILGEEDSPILAIYSHMIDVPLYLPNYPYGHLIEFQLEQQLEGKNIADEIMRIYPVGRLTPNIWMKHAVGKEVSTVPMLDAVTKIIEKQ